MEEKQTHESTSVKPPSPDSESQPRTKEERKEEDVTPKSDAAPVGVKNEPTDPDSEDSVRPEEREELRRLIEALPPSSDSTPRQPEEHRGPTGLRTPREPIGPHGPRRSTRPRVRDVSPDP